MPCDIARSATAVSISQSLFGPKRYGSTPTSIPVSTCRCYRMVASIAYPSPRNARNTDVKIVKKPNNGKIAITNFG